MKVIPYVDLYLYLYSARRKISRCDATYLLFSDQSDERKLTTAKKSAVEVFRRSGITLNRLLAEAARII